MAKFELQLPTDIINDIEFVNDNSKKIFGEMTKAGAEVVYNNARANVPKGLRDNASFMQCIKKTRIYETPSDDGIKNRGKISKHPFFRKSFKKAQIEQAMINAQKQYSKGILK